MIITILLALIVVVIVGALIYLAMDYDSHKKLNTEDHQKTATQLGDLSAADARIQREYNAAIAKLSSNVRVNDLSLASNQAVLRTRLDAPLLSTSNQTMIKTRLDNPLFSVNHQTAVKNYLDRPYAPSSNLFQVKVGTTPMYTPNSVTRPRDPNVSLDLLQKVSFLSGLTVKDIDNVNTAAFCFKSTGKCTRMDTNGLTIDGTNNVNVSASNLWVDAPMHLKAGRKLSFKTSATSPELASVSYNSSLTSVHAKNLSANRLHLTNAAGTSATLTGNNVDIFTTATGAAIAVGQNAKIHIGMKTSPSQVTPFMTVERLSSGKVQVSTGAQPLVINGNVEIRGSLKTRAAPVTDTAIPGISTTNTAPVTIV